MGILEGTDQIFNAGMGLLAGNQRSPVPVNPYASMQNSLMQGQLLKRQQQQDIVAQQQAAMKQKQFEAEQQAAIQQQMAPHYRSPPWQRQRYVRSTAHSNESSGRTLLRR